MRKLNLLLLLIVFVKLVNGQDQAQNDRNITLKLPLSSFAGDICAESMGIGLGLEKMIKPGLAISQELNYIFHVDNASILKEALETINGIKLTTEVRKYLSKNEAPQSGFFVTTEMKNIFTNSTKEAVSIEGVKARNEINRYRSHLTLNVGMLFYWDKNKNSNLTIELLGGGGLGYVNAESSIDTDNLVERSKYNTANKIYPCFNLDIKIGYVIK
ncbi:MAG: hypothetical protein PF489_12950 [Salinivirgaceae bacterium]|jgi:hypothetical protein|nr:hypothetical protein [Salinivirgaceae bacterium]